MGRDIEEQVAEMQPGGAATIDELLTSEAGEFGKAQWLALGVGGLTFFSGTRHATQPSRHLLNKQGIKEGITSTDELAVCS
jgi:hypothetical protein